MSVKGGGNRVGVKDRASPPEQGNEPRAGSALTQKCILDAAEALFSELGYTASSLRAIADAAGVNLAAANYHFGSKEALLTAALQRCVAPINDERARRLDALELEAGALTVENIVHAFLDPVVFGTVENDAVVEHNAVTGEKVEALPRLIARIFAEPKSISSPLLQRVFGPIATRFIAALGQAMPGVSSADLQWRFHFMIGAMVHFLNFEQPLALAQAGKSGESLSPAASRTQLIQFVIAGIRQ